MRTFTEYNTKSDIIAVSVCLEQNFSKDLRHGKSIAPSLPCNSRIKSDTLLHSFGTINPSVRDIGFGLSMHNCLPDECLGGTKTAKYMSSGIINALSVQNLKSIK